MATIQKRPSNGRRPVAATAPALRRCLPPHRARRAPFRRAASTRSASSARARRCTRTHVHDEAGCQAIERTPPTHETRGAASDARESGLRTRTRGTGTPHRTAPSQDGRDNGDDAPAGRSTAARASSEHSDAPVAFFYPFRWMGERAGLSRILAAPALSGSKAGEI